MALIKCVECERKISTLADSCPHCGAPLRHSTEADESESGGGDSSGCILKTFLIIIVVGLIYLLGKKHIDPFLISIKEKIVKDSGGSSSSGKKGGKDAPPDILRRKSPEAVENEAKKELVDPDLGEEITKNLLHPKDDPNAKKADDEEPPDVLGVKKPDPDKETAPEPTETDAPKADPVPEKEKTEEPEKQPESVKKEPEATESTAGDKETTPSDPLLAAAENLKLKIIGKIERAADEKLIVTVNENWPMLSNEQKKEAASAVYDLWVEKGGSTIEFRNSNGDKVATMNLSTKLIHGKVSFMIHDTK